MDVGVTGSVVSNVQLIAFVPGAALEKVVMTTSLRVTLRVQVLPVGTVYGLNQNLAILGLVVSRPTKFWATRGGFVAAE